MIWNRWLLSQKVHDIFQSSVCERHEDEQVIHLLMKVIQLIQGCEFHSNVWIPLQWFLHMHLPQVCECKCLIFNGLTSEYTQRMNALQILEWFCHNDKSSEYECLGDVQMPHLWMNINPIFLECVFHLKYLNPSPVILLHVKILSVWMPWRWTRASSVMDRHSTLFRSKIWIPFYCSKNVFKILFGALGTYW